MGRGKAGNDIEWEAKGRFALLVKKEGERMKREEKEEQMKMYSVILGDNKKHLKAVLLSDLHIGTFVDQKQTRKIVEAVNKISADFVVIAGDTFDEGAFAHCARAEISQELQKMCPKGQVYAALGNHDPSSNDPDVRTFFQEAAEKGADLVLCTHTHKGQFFRQRFLRGWLMGNKDFMDMEKKEIRRVLYQPEQYSKQKAQ